MHEQESPKRRNPLLRALAFLWRLVNAAVNVFAAIVIVVAGVGVGLTLYFANTPIDVADGQAPIWQAVRAHVSDMRGTWSKQCWSFYVQTVPFIAPMPLGGIKAAYDQGKLTPEAVAYYGGQSFEYVAFMNIGGFTLSPEEGRRQFVCYIRPPIYRTVDSLADAPWPWEVSPPAEEPFP